MLTYKQTVKKSAHIRFQLKRPIKKLSDINMNSTIAGSMNAPS